MGLEPTTFGLEVQRAIHCATRAVVKQHQVYNIRLPQASETLWPIFFRRHHQAITTLDGTRTHNLWIRSPTRYPLRHSCGTTPGLQYSVTTGLVRITLVFFFEDITQQYEQL
eukprot:284818379_2